jgi:hypothetical protein
LRIIRLLDVRMRFQRSASSSATGIQAKEGILPFRGEFHGRPEEMHPSFL